MSYGEERIRELDRERWRLGYYGTQAVSVLKLISLRNPEKKQSGGDRQALGGKGER